MIAYIHRFIRLHFLMNHQAKKRYLHGETNMAYRGGEVRKTFDLGKFIIAKLKKGKAQFEMIADPERAWDAKKLLAGPENKEKDKELVKLSPAQVLKNENINLTEIFPTFDLFTNVKKAEAPTEEQLMEAFQTTDKPLIAAIFLLEAEFAWTKTQRDKWVEIKKKQIITILSRNSINPQTKKPHPPQRLEKALEEAHVNIDINRTAEEQVEEIIKKIAVVLPIRMESVKMAVKVPAVYAPKAYNIVEKFAQIIQSEWQNDGSWIGMVSMPAGLQTEFLEKLNNLTHGRVETKLLNN